MITKKRDRAIYMRGYLNKRRLQFRLRVNEFKKEIGKCQECGYSEHWEILQFHHRDKEEKKFKISGGNFAYRSWDNLKKELDKCILLCPNCHSWMHFNEKEWFLEQAINGKK